jgi:TRAP transporter TAXI family solute receptor
MCRIINKYSKRDNIRCSVEATPATIFNINVLRGNEVDFAIIQSDWAYYAYAGKNAFKSFGPMPKLRSIFSMHTEAFTIVASSRADIKALDDLKGKRVNIGNPGSGVKATMELLMQKRGWSKEDFKFASDLGSSEQAQALCDNKVDAIMYFVGHINGGIQEAASTCDIKIIPVPAEDVGSIMDGNSHYIETTIPGGLYQGVPEEITTFGVKSLFVTSEDIEEELVYKVTKDIIEDLKNFKAIHPSLANLTIEDMMPDNSIIPIHKGAERYYKEIGYLN